MTRKLVLGAVAYDPKVITIWDGFQRYFAARNLPFDYVLFTNYEKQVEAQFDGVIDVAWNSPLAWVQSVHLANALGRKASAIAMRDTDCDLTTVIAVRSDSRFASPADLNGARIGFGAADSPQATILPQAFLLRAGVSQATIDGGRLFDVSLGKHGDHVGGERDAARALARGELDASCVLDANLAAFMNEGIWAQGAIRILARTPRYDHCNFTVLDGAPPELVARFLEELLAMDYANPEVRPLLDLEGLKAWRAGRTQGYQALEAAVVRSPAFARWLEAARHTCK